MNPNPIVPDRLTRDRAVLVVVDIQERFRQQIHGLERMLANARRLVEFSHHLELPVLVTEHYPRGLGVTMAEMREATENVTPIEKIDFSCCGSDAFVNRLDKLGRDQVVLCGIETHVCIYQTACDLRRDGRQVVVAADAVSSCSAANRDLGLQALRNVGVQVLGVQMIMFEILRKAGTPLFKQVAPLLKE